MIDDDRDLREALEPLRAAPVPPAPDFRPRRSPLAAVVAAAGLLALLAWVMRPPAPPAPAQAEPPLTLRLNAIDLRVESLEPTLLRDLLLQEAALLREEARLAGLLRD